MSDPSLVIRPWRPCPFEKGRSYRVRRPFVALRDSFAEGEILVFDSDAWSRYDGYTGYFFRQEGREHLRLWDIADEDSTDWRELFEEVPARPPGP